MNLTALSVGFAEKMGKGNHYRHEKVEEAVVSRVKGKGNVLLTGKIFYPKVHSWIVKRS